MGPPRVIHRTSRSMMNMPSQGDSKFSIRPHRGKRTAPLSAAAEDPEAYGAWLSDLTARSLIQSDKAVAPEDRILLLTTDAREEYGFAGARFVVAARLQGAGETAPTYRVSQSPLMPDALTEAEPAAATKTTLPTAGSTLPNDDNGASR